MRSACDRLLRRPAPDRARLYAFWSPDALRRYAYPASEFRPLAGVSASLTQGEGFEPSMDQNGPERFFEISAWSYRPSSELDNAPVRQLEGGSMAPPSSGINLLGS